MGQQQEQEQLVLLNGKEFTLPQFQEQKEILESKNGVKVVKVSENIYKTLIQG